MANVIFHELAGINIIFLYSDVILNQVLTGGGFFTPRVGVYTINIVNTIASIISVWTVRKFGRRPLLLYGFAGIFICHLLTGTFILTKFNIGIILMMCAFMAVY